MKLNELRDNPGSRKKRIRVGRGLGSGKGKTCGRGVKGQKARTGVSIHGFEGGQNPLYRRLPKRGFSNQKFRITYTILNLKDLQSMIESKSIDIQQKITEDTFRRLGILKKKDAGIKILGEGKLNVKIDLEVCTASKAARCAIEKMNGQLTLTKNQNGL